MPVEASFSKASATAITTSALLATSTPEGEAEAPALPSTCEATGKKNLCTPDADFAKRLCAGEFPDVALSMFKKESPWTRGYMRMNVEAWNATGSRTHRTKLVFDEELLVIQHRQAEAGGIVMLGAHGETGSYDVLRWDGSCVSVMAEEITLARPPQPKRAQIPWRHLDEGTRLALLEAPKVKSTYELLGKACVGNETKCTQAEGALSGAVIDFVRGGGLLPQPTRRP
ncbi:MAG: hypothetical protein ABIP39_03170 [Polyangiaceae bacterium]